MKKLALFLGSCGLMLCTACVAPESPADESTVGVGKSFKGPIGLQLYSLRDQFAKDVPGTLAKAKAYGFQYVELAGTYKHSAAEFRELLDANGLKAVAAHFPFDRFRDDVEGLAADARALGLSYAGVAWIPHQAPFSEQACREAAAVFNKAGEVLIQHGVKVFYHQHGYEFQPHAEGTLMDLLITETNPDLVTFEMDTLWTVFPGHDPVSLLRKHGKRWELMHLKDLKKGVETGDQSGRGNVEWDVVLGAGQMDMPAILKAAEQAGVKYYFIEDESPRAEVQVPESLRFLEQVQF